MSGFAIMYLGLVFCIAEMSPSRWALNVAPDDPVYRQGVIGVAIWFAVGMIYFAIAGRHRLVLSPEEEFALGKGKVEYRSY